MNNCIVSMNGSTKIRVLLILVIGAKFVVDLIAHRRTPAICPNATTNIKKSFELARTQSFGFFDDIDDKQWELHHNIYIQHVNHMVNLHPPDYDLSGRADKWYASNYEPNFGGCSFERRIGVDPNGDGPKWICDPHRIKVQALARKAKDAGHPGCVIYSVGSHGNFIFELGMQNAVGEGVCEFHIFDMGDYEHTMPKELKRAHYHRWGLGKQDPNVIGMPKAGQRFYGIRDTIKLLGHESLDVIDVFKIDCEGCEWETYLDWLADDMPRLQQVQVELHGHGRKAVEFFFAMDNAGYVRFHKEPNLFTSGDKMRIEYAFLKLDKTFLDGKPLDFLP